MNTACAIDSAPAAKLHEALGFKTPPADADVHSQKALDEWKMEEDDAPLLRYIYRNFRPRRHLEFGTWQGQGLLYCLEECQASAWTVNLLDGSGCNPDGSYIYANDPEDAPLQDWAARTGMERKSYYHTDSLGFIGWKYLAAGYGSRVCQIYSDSRAWDTSNIPEGFFDSVLIDGSHETETVKSDTRKALPLLRPGGLMLWHDFCPPVSSRFEHTRQVAKAVCQMQHELKRDMAKLFWINPSWILAGIKR